MELPGNHQCGCRATSMEEACRGEVNHRVEVLLYVRDGRAREDDRSQGRRQSTRATAAKRFSKRKR